MAKRDMRSPRKLAKLGGNVGAAQSAVWRIVEKRTTAAGTVAVPCLPSLLDRYQEQLVTLFRTLGRRFSDEEMEQLRRTLAQALIQGFQHSPHSVLVVHYEVHPAPRANLTYSIQLKVRSVEDYYEEWSSEPGGATFGQHPDAMVLEAARQLLPGARVLDVGAGHGRNALPLSRMGFAVDALELVDSLCERLVACAAREALRVEVMRGDLLAEELTLPSEQYDLIVVSEVFSHLRDAAQLERAMVRLTRALAPRGQLVCNVFLAEEGYTPDRSTREASQAALASLFTRPELAAIARGLKLTLVTDESACDYEKLHLPEAHWPPTSWFELWAQGRNVVDLPRGDAPFELRWLVYRKGG